VRAIDLGVITPLEFADGLRAPEDSFHYFASVAGVGLDAEVSRRANKMPRWLLAHGGYALTLAPTIFSFPPFPLKILARDQDKAGAWVARSDQPTMLAAFANSSTYGGGMKIAPNAKIDDGVLDVCVIGGMDPFKLACMFPTVYFGRHLSIREIDYFQTTRAQVETERPFDIYADGEYVCQTPAEIGVQPAALPVIIPASPWVPR
jgi:diacylglycerol kinase family enzyme